MAGRKLVGEMHVVALWRTCFNLLQELRRGQKNTMEVPAYCFGVRLRLGVCFPPLLCGFLPFSTSVGPVEVLAFGRSSCLRTFLTVVA